MVLVFLLVLALVTFQLISCTRSPPDLLFWEEDQYLWVGRGDGLIRWDVLNGVVDAKIQHPADHLLETREGQLWAFSPGIAQLDVIGEPGVKEEGQFDHYMFVQDLAQLSSGELWAATGEGYFVWDHDALEWRLTSIQYHARTLVEDSSGTLWLGLTSDGLIQLDGDIVQHWTDDNILVDNEVYSLLVAQNDSVWAGTRWGIHRWNGRQWERWSDLDVTDADGPVVHTLYETSNGMIWAATSAGITRWNGQSWQAVSEAAMCGGVNSILETIRNSLWVGCQNGIFRWTGAEWQTYGRESGIENNFASFLVEGNGGTLYAATKSGMYQYDVSRDEFVSFPAE